MKSQDKQIEKIETEFGENHFKDGKNYVTMTSQDFKLKMMALKINEIIDFINNL